MGTPLFVFILNLFRIDIALYAVPGIGTIFYTDRSNCHRTREPGRQVAADIVFDVIIIQVNHNVSEFTTSKGAVFFVPANAID